jgi:hypothetical protein
MSSLTFTVLGPARTWRGETELDPGPHPGHPLSPGEIMAVLWDDDPLRLYRSVYDRMRPVGAR